MWVKVCGLTTLDNAVDVANLGVDAIGLNFYRNSKRYISPEIAKEIVAALPNNVQPVGLFVNHSIEEVQHIAELTKISTLQFHGDESPEYVSQFKNYQIIKAFRVNEANVDSLGDQIESFHTSGIELFGCLIDAHVAGEFGGTGQAAPWDLLTEVYDVERFPPLILAGGLNPENVQDAVNCVHPWGVDTASGVEASPGVKDLELTRKFIELSRTPQDSSKSN